MSSWKKPIYHTRTERFKLMLVELLGIIDAVIFIASIGFIVTNFRVRLLFSDWMER